MKHKIPRLLPLFIPLLVFISCSHVFESKAQVSISFPVSQLKNTAARAGETTDLSGFIQVELYSDNKLFGSEGKAFTNTTDELIFDFADLEIGSSVYAKVEVLTMGDTGQLKKIYEGTSEPVTIKSGDNEIIVPLKKLDDGSGDEGGGRTPDPNEGKVSYKIQHLLQNIDDDEYTLDLETTESGETDKQTAAEALEYTGFRPHDIIQKTIAADGSTVVTIYYDRVCYTVTYLDGTDDEEITMPATMTHKYGSTVQIDFDLIGSREHYELVCLKNGSEKYSKNGQRSFVMPDADVVLTAEWVLISALNISASFDTGTQDIEVYNNENGFTGPITVNDSTSLITLDVRKIEGKDSDSFNNIVYEWSFDGVLLDRNGTMPAGVTFDSSSSDRQIDIQASDLATGVYDVYLEVTCNGTGNHYSFMTQIIKQ